MLKKSLFIRLDGFSNDPEMTGLDDLDFFVRLFLSNANIVHVPGVVQCWVKHKQNYSNSESFQDARLRWLKRLSELAQHYPMLNNELKYFRFHTYAMRGLHFLETGRAELGMADFYKAILHKPSSLNTYYLFFKSIFIAGAKFFRLYVPRPKNNFEV
jgi:hypothetical protein